MDVKTKFTQFRLFWSSLPEFVCQDENVASQADEPNCWDTGKRSWWADHMSTEQSTSFNTSHLLHDFFLLLSQEHLWSLRWIVFRFPSDGQHTKESLQRLPVALRRLQWDTVQQILQRILKKWLQHFHHLSRSLSLLGEEMSGSGSGSGCMESCLSPTPPFSTENPRSEESSTSRLHPSNFLLLLPLVLSILTFLEQQR